MTLRDRAWLLISLCCLGAGGIAELVPPPEDSARLEAIPMRGTGFSGQDLTMTESMRAGLKGARLLQRRYSFRGRPFLVTVLDGSGNRAAVHDPTYCLRGDGATVVNLGTVELANGTARRMRVETDQGTSEALLWFSSPESQFRSFPRYWAMTAWRRLTLGNGGNEPLLVTVETAVEPGVEADWTASARDWFPQLGL